LDWTVSNRVACDQKTLDALFVYGIPFPPRDADGKVTSYPSEKIPMYDMEYRPRIINVMVRAHDGVDACAPFTITPSQLVCITR